MSDDMIQKISEKNQEQTEDFLATYRDFVKSSKKPILTVGMEREDAARMMAKMAGYGKYLARVK